MGDESPKKKESKKSKEKHKTKDMEGAEEPESFLSPQGQIFPWLEQSYVDGMNKIAKQAGLKQPFEWKKIGVLPVGALIYRQFKANGSAPASVYLAKITFKGELTRLHYADGAVLAQTKDDIYWDDAENNMHVYVVCEPEEGEEDRSGKTDKAAKQTNWSVTAEESRFEQAGFQEYLETNSTLKRANQERMKERKEMLSEVIERLAKMKESELTGQMIEDTERKVKDEMTEKYGVPSSDRTTWFGMTGGNVGIIQKYFDDDKQEQAETEMVREMKEMKEMKKRIEKKMNAQGKMTEIKNAAQGTKKAMPSKGELVSMPGDQQCLFHFLGAAEQIIEGTAMGDVKFDQNRVDNARSQIVNNAIAYGEVLKNQGKNDEEIQKDMQNQLGETLDEFCTNVTNSISSGKHRQGGFVEASMWQWRTPVLLIIVDADAEESEQRVYDVVWPEDDRGKEGQRVMIAVKNRGHYYLWEMGEALFEHGEEHQRALEACLEHVRPQARRVSWADVARVKDVEKRKEMIKENMHAGVLKAKKSKTRKKKKGGGGGEAEQSSGATMEAWKDMARKHGWVEKNSQQSQTTSNTADTGQALGQVGRGGDGGARTQGGGTRDWVSAVVVYTPVPGDVVLDTVGRKDKAVRSLIQAARQKPGHVVLMAKREDSEKLKECVKAFELWGFQAKTYALRNRLQGNAAEGTQNSTSKAGLCRNYMKGRACPYGAKCKFTCHPNVQQRG